MDHAVAAAFAANLLLQPAVVHTLIHYWMQHVTLMPMVQHGPTIAMLTADDPGELFGTFIRTLAARPSDLVLRGQSAGLPTAAARAPRPMYMWQWLTPVKGPALVVPDEQLMTAPFGALLDTMGALAAAPERFWARICHGGLRGHVVADSFRFTAVLAAAYRPVIFIVHACRLLLEQLVARAPLTARQVFGATWVRRYVAAPLALIATEPGLAPAERVILAQLAATLDAEDLQDLLLTVAALAARLDAAMLLEYKRWGARSVWPRDVAVPPEDVARLLAAAATPLIPPAKQDATLQKKKKKPHVAATVARHGKRPRAAAPIPPPKRAKKTLT